MSSSENSTDDNRRVLASMIASGDDLSTSRTIDFTVVFPTESAARNFKTKLLLSFESVVKIQQSKVVPNLPWDATVGRFMVPTLAGICDFEDQLQALAFPLGGRNDGWGCFEQPIPSSERS